MRLSSVKMLLAKVLAQARWQLAGTNCNIGSRVPVLCYHRVLPDFIEEDMPTIYTVTPEQFECQMAFLVNNSFRSLTLKEYESIAEGRRPACERSVLITFDDGYADNYFVAWPIAQQYGVKINLFISTALINTPGPVLMCEETSSIQMHVQKFPELWRSLTWDELRTMHASEVHMGLHGHTHRNTASIGKEELIREVALAIHIFEKELGNRPRTFALPYGGPGTYSTKVLQTLKSSGLELVFSSLPGRTQLPCKRLPFSRFMVTQHDDLSSIEMKLFGAYDWVGKIRRIEQMFRESLMRL